MLCQTSADDWHVQMIGNNKDHDLHTFWFCFLDGPWPLVFSSLLGKRPVGRINGLPGWPFLFGCKPAVGLFLGLFSSQEIQRREEMLQPLYTQATREFSRTVAEGWDMRRCELGASRGERGRVVGTWMWTCGLVGEPGGITFIKKKQKTDSIGLNESHIKTHWMKFSL